MTTGNIPVISLLLNEKLLGLIWKLEIDSDSNLLFAEVRNKQEHQVSFTSIDLNTGKINFTNLKAEERWYTGLEGACNGMLFLHGYDSPSSPAHKGIIAVDAATGKTVWANYLLAVHQFCKEGLVVFDTRIQPRRLQLIDYKTGATIRTASLPDLTDLKSNILYPESKDIGIAVLKGHLKAELTGEIRVAEHHDLRIVSLHTVNNLLFNQHLLILQGDKLVFQDLLNEDIQKLQPEAFVIHSGKLIYIKNHSEIKVLNL